MRWKDLKLSLKCSFSFGLVITLLVIVAVWATIGIAQIVGDADEVIDGNKLRTELTHKYVQHLQWARDLNKYLTDDNVTELTVQTDHTLCAFGQWYYGDGRKDAEALAPELKPLFDEIEVPHKSLHSSAIRIKEIFQQADRKLGAKLREAKADHLIWAHRVKDVAVNGVRVNNVDVQKDGTQCNFGKWLHSPEIAKLKTQNADFAAMLAKIEDPHDRLHAAVHQFEAYYRQGNVQQGKNYYMNNIKPNTYEVLDIIDEMIAWNDTRLDGMDEATDIYNNETMVFLDQVGGIFDQLVEKSEDYIMTDQVMLKEARNTRGAVILFSLVASLFAIVLSIVISRGIVNPIKKGVFFAKQVSEGNLTAEVDIDQKDEVGVLASSLKTMVDQLKSIVANIRVGAENITAASQQMSTTSQQMSQGSSEQASSAEEVSSSMEEMVANIQQNTDNSQETEKIALQAMNGIVEGNQSSEVSIKAMREIADKITIVNDIAFQTNILALNAAVEAARAGEHGKGFAVVAAEVRKLAERSKIAADEIDTISKNGVEISDKAGQQLASIVPEIEKTARLVQEISAASLEQNSGADQVNNAIQQLNQVTQQNAASSEELATSAEELASQSEQLLEIISFFRIDNSVFEEVRRRNNGISDSKFTNQKIRIKEKKPEDIKNGNEGVELVLQDTKSNDQYEKF